MNLSGERLPCANTYTYALSRLDAEQLTDVVAHFFRRLDAQQRCGTHPSRLLADPAREAHRHVALDGKTRQSTFKHGSAEQAAVHLLALYEVTSGIVLAQRQVRLKENEITGAPDLLTFDRLIRRILTADALHTQKKFCLHLKKHEADSVLFFEDPGADRSDWCSQTTWNKGPGRLEQRTVTTSRKPERRFCQRVARH